MREENQKREKRVDFLPGGFPSLTVSRPDRRCRTLEPLWPDEGAGIIGGSKLCPDGFSDKSSVQPIVFLLSFPRPSNMYRWISSFESSLLSMLTSPFS